MDAPDGGRIRYKRVCAVDGEEVDYADIAKGYETEDGEMVILTDDDMAELPTTSSREIAVEKFVPSDQIDPMLFEKSYYLEPEKSAQKPYALARSGKTSHPSVPEGRSSARSDAITCPWTRPPMMTVSTFRVSAAETTVPTAMSSWPDQRASSAVAVVRAGPEIARQFNCMPVLATCRE